MNSNAIQKILIIGPAWVGDMVMAQVLFKQLKIINPNAIIDVMAPGWSEPLLERMPEVRKALVMPLGHGALDLKTRWQLGVALRAEKYDQAIVLPNSWKSGVVPLAARIPLRTGWRGEFRYGLLNDVRYLDKNKLPLMIQRFSALGMAKNAELPQQLPKPALKISEQTRFATLTKFNLQLDKPVLAICPGAEFGPAKRWPANYFAEVANDKLIAGMQVWIFGSAKDQGIAAEIQRLTNNRCVDLTGRTTLGEAVDLLSLPTQVITNDSGLMHIAASLQRPMTVIYGSSSSRFTPPLSDNVKILSLNLPCSPCFKRECPLGHLNCLHDLTPELVIKNI